MPPTPKSKIKKQGNSSSKEETCQISSDPRTDLTTKYCLICDTELETHSQETETTRVAFRKMLDCFCLFLNLEVAENKNWNFENENFPFCRSCSEYLHYLTVFYDQLEVVHNKVAQVVTIVKRKFAKTFHGNTTVSSSTGRPKNKRDDLRASSDLRARSFRDLIEISVEDFSPHDDSPLPELISSNMTGNLSGSCSETPTVAEVKPAIKSEEKECQTHRVINTNNKDCQTQMVIVTENKEPQTQVISTNSEETQTQKVISTKNEETQTRKVISTKNEECQTQKVISTNNKECQTQKVISTNYKECQTQTVIITGNKESQTAKQSGTMENDRYMLNVTCVTTQTESIFVETEDTPSDVPNFGKHVADQLQQLESEKEREEKINKIQVVLAEYSKNDVNVISKNDDEVEAMEVPTDSPDWLIELATGIKSSEVPVYGASTHGFPAQSIPASESDSRYNKLVLVPKPSWSIVHTKEGFKYGDIETKSIGSSYICCLCPEKMSYCSKEKILDHLEFQHLGMDHWYPCYYCEDNFRLVGQLHKHVRASHVGKPDKSWNTMCHVCHKRFFSPELVERHLRIHGIYDAQQHFKRTSCFASDKVTTASSNTVDVTSSDSEPMVMTISTVRKSLRPRTSKRKVVDVTPESEVEDTDVVLTDSLSEEFYSSDSDFGAKRRKKSNLKKQKPLVKASQSPPAAVPTPTLEALEEIGLNKELLCGGCGCRYFTESEATIKTIKQHYGHHKLQRALACSICCRCFISLPEMNAHVRDHFNSGNYSNYIFYCPSPDSPTTTTTCRANQDTESSDPVGS